MATRLERMEESLANYKAKIVETEGKIAEEKKALIAKRGEAEAKLAEAKKKFDDLYGSLPTIPTGPAETAEADNTEDTNDSLFDAPVEG